MKNYRITVNGVAYDVAVEELGAGEASAAPVSTPAAVPAPAKKAAPKTSGSAGAVKIMLHKFIFMLPAPFNELRFFVVMSDQCNVLFAANCKCNVFLRHITDPPYFSL